MLSHKGLTSPQCFFYVPFWAKYPSVLITNTTIIYYLYMFVLKNNVGSSILPFIWKYCVWCIIIKVLEWTEWHNPDRFSPWSDCDYVIVVVGVMLRALIGLVRILVSNLSVMKKWFTKREAIILQGYSSATHTDRRSAPGVIGI